MKNFPLILLAVVAFLPNLVVADNQTDSHVLSIIVPEVKLLHIKNGFGAQEGNDSSTLLNFQVDSVEKNSPVSSSYYAKGYYDITANVEAGTSKTRSIMVSAEGLDNKWKLTVSSADVPRAFPHPVTLTKNLNSGELVSGVSNIAMSNIELNYKLEPTSPKAESALDFANEGLVLTFTLTDDT